MDLVVDVGRYPEFLPWCVGARIRSRDQGSSVEILTADLSIGYRGIRESFTSRVRVDRSRNRVDVDYLDGPFRRLHNAWIFEARDGGGCVIDFFIDFELRNRLLGLAAEQVFGLALQRMIEAFEKRAHELYKVPVGK